MQLEQYYEIRKLHESITDNSIALSISSEEMSATSTKFSDSAQDQAASVELITSSIDAAFNNMETVVFNTAEQFLSMNILIDNIDRLSNSISQMKDVVEETARISEKTSRESKSGEDVLDTMNVTMSAINQSSEEIASTAEKLKSKIDNH